jgi:hypothetical protein
MFSIRGDLRPPSWESSRRTLPRSIGQRARRRKGRRRSRDSANLMALGKRLPIFREFVRLGEVADSPITPQSAIRVPRPVWPHDFFEYDVLVCQQPQKAQLSKAAKRELLNLKTTEPSSGHAMEDMSFRRQRNPDLDVRQVGHQNRSSTSPWSPDGWRRL